MTWIMVTWNGMPHTMTMRRFDTQDDAELAAYTWMIEQNIIGPDLPIDDMLAWWFDTEDGGCCEDFTTGCVIQEVNS